MNLHGRSPAYNAAVPVSETNRIRDLDAGRRMSHGAQVIYDTYGLGIGFVRFPKNVIESVQITSHTPVDDTHTDYWFMQSSVRKPGDIGNAPSGRARRFLEAQQQLVQQDFVIWENMQYLDEPNFTPEEVSDYTAFRKWAQAFYPPEQPS